MEKDKKIDEFEELLEGDDNLTDKERMFCLNYLRHFNAAKSYRESFGETKFDKQAAHLLLKKEKISNYIQKLKKELFTDTLLDSKDILEQYIKIAFADITDYVNFGAEEVVDENGKTYTRNYLRFKDSNTVDSSMIEYIAGGKAPTIKLSDKTKALEMLSKYTNLIDGDTDKEFKLVIKRAGEND
ncbi:terminase small subunit [Peribacillus simplex]|uniref:Phage terminase small subunit n=1 Tax=Peribacillus simplex TaxID=1478 RepID=A0AAN2PF47_9BACI|nr:terminase small subunit [Peribacillus simplex]CEG31432.1 phage terminase small subunit [Peribacillus simplex]